MDTTILWSFVGATSLLAISPGPDNMYVLIQSIRNGIKSGLATVIGLISGCILHTTLVAFGVSALIKENETVFFALKVFGSCYLIYLAYTVFKSNPSISLDKQPLLKKSNWGLFKQGVIMNVLNPKVSIFFLAFFPSFLFSTELTTIHQFFVLGFIFMGTSLIIFSAIAVLAGSISNLLNRSKNISIFLKWMQITVFIAIAIFILFSD